MGGLWSVVVGVGPPVFLLVVDTCLEDVEMEHLKDSLQQVRRWDSRTSSGSTVCSNLSFSGLPSLLGC